MHIKAITKASPAEAQSAEQILDVISQFLSVLRGIETVFGVDFSELLGKD